MIGAILYGLLGLMILLLPGFLLSLVAYPKKDQLELSSRLMMSFGLGVLLQLYVGFFLARMGLLSLSPFLLSSLLLCLGLGLVAWVRGAYPFPSFRFPWVKKGVQGGGSKGGEAGGGHT